MPSTQPAKKVCTVCGADVEGKPRVKDAQGRYVCKGACEAKLVKKLAAPDARDIPLAEPDDVMAKLVASSPVVNAKPCTSCGSPMREGAVVCTNCGTNIESGKKIKTAIIKEKAPKEPGALSKLAASGGPSFGTLLMLLCLVLGGIAAAGFFHPFALVGSLFVLVPIGLCSTIATILSGFRNGSGLIALFLTPVYGLLMDPNKWSRALYIAMSLAGIIVVLAFMSQASELEKLAG